MTIAFMNTPIYVYPTFWGVGGSMIPLPCGLKMDITNIVKMDKQPIMAIGLRLTSRGC
jgi:hypothetical protein